MTIAKGLLLAGTAAAALSAAAPGLAQDASSNPILAGKPLLDMRLRYEQVDQQRIAEEAQSLTLRTRLGWETAKWNDLQALIEVENVVALVERYSVPAGGSAPPLNGADKARYPGVSDPEVTELNRAQIAWTPGKGFGAVVGRQRITIDDQRFVGNSAWRQDEQTFDAVRLDGAVGKLKASYAYVSKVNRTLGEERDWDSDSHILHAALPVTDVLALQGYVLALDLRDQPATSNLTWAGKATFTPTLAGVKVSASGTYAHQSDHRGNTPEYDLDYWAADLAGTHGMVTVRLAYESLEGDGRRNFFTPLGSGHNVQGWADAVNTASPTDYVDGVEDLNLSLSLKPKVTLPFLSKPELFVRRHAFDSQRTGADIGSEWDLLASAAISKRLTAFLKYADFERERTVPAGTATPPASRTKIFVYFEFKL
jgi:hypothetical protein